MDPQRGLIEVQPPGNAHGETPKSFTFDAVYDWKCVLHLFYISNKKAVLCLYLSVDTYVCKL